MSSNRGVVYMGSGKVEVQTIDFPKLVDPRGNKYNHGVILKIVSTNICGSDQHMVRGRTTAPSAQLLGAAVVIVGAGNPDRLAHARSIGCETVDISKDASIVEQIEQILGVPEVDCAVDCVGFEAHGHGKDYDPKKGVPAIVLNTMMEVTRAGGAVGIPGLYVTEDPGAEDEAAKLGYLTMRFGLGWAKSLSFYTGQTPVKKYNRGLMMAILNDKIQIAKAVNVQVIPLEEAPQGYQAFDKGAAKKFVIDPHGSLK